MRYKIELEISEEEKREILRRVCLTLTRELWRDLEKEVRAMVRDELKKCGFLV